MAYVDYIPDAFSTPQEMWYHPDDEMTYCLLRVNVDVVFVAIVKDSIYQGFDVIINDNDKVNALRCGILKYSMKTS